MFNLKKISSRKLDWNNVCSEAFSFLERNIRWVFFLALATLVLYGSFVWYKYVFGPGWSEARKQEYIKGKDKGAVLNEQAFEGIVAERERRIMDSQKEREDIADIFRLDSQKTPPQ